MNVFEHPSPVLALHPDLPTPTPMFEVWLRRVLHEHGARLSNTPGDAPIVITRTVLEMDYVRTGGDRGLQVLDRRDRHAGHDHMPFAVTGAPTGLRLNLLTEPEGHRYTLNPVWCPTDRLMEPLGDLRYPEDITIAATAAALPSIHSVARTLFLTLSLHARNWREVPSEIEVTRHVLTRAIAQLGNRWQRREHLRSLLADALAAHQTTINTLLGDETATMLLTPTGIELTNLQP